MKRINYIIMFIMIISMNICNVYASEVTISCPSNAKLGSSFNCTIKANHDKEYGGVELTPVFSSGLTFNSFNIGSGYLGNMNTSMLSVYSDDNKNGSTVIGIINVTIHTNINNTNNSTTILIFR